MTLPLLPVMVVTCIVPINCSVVPYKRDLHDRDIEVNLGKSQAGG